MLNESIIKKESYIAGYNKPIMTAQHFKDCIWDKFQKSKRFTPSDSSNILDSQKGRNQMSYIAQITETYTAMLCFIHFKGLQPNYLDWMKLWQNWQKQ